MPDVKNVINQMVSGHFPELEKTHIVVRNVAKEDYYMAAQWTLFYYVLFIDKAITRFGDDAFKGCLAHELAHIVLMKKQSLLEKLNIIDPGEEERAADLILIQRGLGKELLQFHNEHNKKYKSYKRYEGLTRREIEKLLKQ